MSVNELIKAVEMIIDIKCKAHTDKLFGVIKNEFGDKVDMNRLKELYEEFCQELKAYDRGTKKAPMDENCCRGLTASGTQCSRPPLINGLCKTHSTIAEKSKLVSLSEKSEIAAHETSSTLTSETK